MVFDSVANATGTRDLDLRREHVRYNHRHDLLFDYGAGAGPSRYGFVMQGDDAQALCDRADAITKSPREDSLVGV
jgi:hypothetical protein